MIHVWRVTRGRSVPFGIRSVPGIIARRAGGRWFRLDAIGLAVVLAVVAGCTSTETGNEGQEVPPDTAESQEESGERQAPWRQDSLSAAEVPGVYLEAWRQAENRAACALIAPDSLGRGGGAEARRAQFGGGWGVAYDLPQLRSAFGVAGTGVSYTDDTYDEWPNSRTWAGGSYAGYGPEGGSGSENQLAYVRIEGQDCLYNVWSRLGIDHLEMLLEHLRFVAVSSVSE